MLSEYLKKLKEEPCLRLDINAYIKEGRQRSEQFRTRFPNLLGDMTPSDFDLPKGWVHIVSSVFAFLNKEKVKVTRVKQKFAELRIYTDIDYADKDKDNNAEVRRLIMMAETFSLSTCEFCGGTDKVSIWEQSYVARVCIDCKRKMAEYQILNYVLEDSRVGTENEKYALSGFKYAQQVLREIYNGTEKGNRNSFYEFNLSRIAEQSGGVEKSEAEGSNS
jgi:hypothetical protein